MYRIDNSSAIPNLPVPGPPGTPGFFTDGNPAAALEATIVDAWWANIIQEEIMTVVQAASLPPRKDDHTQLLQALNRLYQAAGGNFLPLSGGLMTGFITLHAPPALPMHATNRQYVDDAVNAAMSGTGYVPEAPPGPYTYGRLDAAWNPVLPLTGGTIYNAGFANVLALQTAGNADNQLRFIGARNWSIGVQGFVDPGEFWIFDHSVGGLRLRISLDGHVTVPGNLYSGWLFSSGNISAALDIGGRGLYMTGPGQFGGDLGVTGTGWFNGAVNVSGRLVCGDFQSNQNVYASSGYVFAGTYVQAGTYVYASGNVEGWDVKARGGLYSDGSLSVTNSAIIGIDLDVDRDIRSHRNLLCDHDLDVGWDCRIQAALEVGSLGAGIYLVRADPGNGFVNIAGNFTVAGNATITGTVTAAAFNPSDRSLKQNITDYQRGLDIVRELRPVSYEWNGRGGFTGSGQPQIGFVAQDVEAFMPEAVADQLIRSNHEPVTIKALDPMALTAALVNAVNELTARLETLERTR